MRLVARSTPSTGSTRTGLVREGDYSLPASTDPEQRFALLYETLFPRLCDLVRQYVRLEDPRDVVHNAMADIWRRWDDLAPHLPGRGFFVRAVLNQILLTKRRKYFDRLRTERFLQHVTAHPPPPPFPAADVALEAASVPAIIDAAVAELPPRCKAVWVAIRQQKLTYEEAAKSLGLELVTVKSHMTRAGNLVREALITAGYDVHRRRLGASAPKLLSATTTPPEDGDAHD